MGGHCSGYHCLSIASAFFILCFKPIRVVYRGVYFGTACVKRGITVSGGRRGDGDEDEDVDKNSVEDDNVDDNQSNAEGGGGGGAESLVSNDEHEEVEDATGDTGNGTIFCLFWLCAFSFSLVAIWLIAMACLVDLLDRSTILAGWAIQSCRFRVTRSNKSVCGHILHGGAL